MKIIAICPLPLIVLSLSSCLQKKEAPVIQENNAVVEQAAVDPIQTKLDEARNTVRARHDAHVQAVTNGKSTFLRPGGTGFFRAHNGKKSQGTVVIFHGFSSRVAQQIELEEYLFNAGYDIYQGVVAGHMLVNKDGKDGTPLTVNWPVTTIKPQCFGKLQGDAAKMAGSTDAAKVQPILGKLVYAAVSDDTQFPSCFDSTHDQYFQEVKDTYEIVKDLPGNLYAVGLSGGGTQAIALGALPAAKGKIKAVAAYAPLLQNSSDLKDVPGMGKMPNIVAVRSIGTLWNIMPLPWNVPSEDSKYPLGSAVALEKFGQTVLKSPDTKAAYGDGSAKLFLVTTAKENETAADPTASDALFTAMGGTTNGHVRFEYAKNMDVPHPINQLHKRGGLPMSTRPNCLMINHYWRTLYQETLRIFAEGTVKTERLSQQDLVDAYPGWTKEGFGKLDEQTTDSGRVLPIPTFVNLWKVDGCEK